MEKIWLHSYPADVPETIDIQAHPSFVHMFDHPVGQFGQQPAFVQQQQTLSYGELDRLSRDLAAYLGSCGRGGEVSDEQLHRSEWRGGERG